MIECPRCRGEGEVDSGAADPQGVWINVTCPTCNGNGYVVSVAELRDRIENPPYHEYMGDVAYWYYCYGAQDHPYRDLNYALTRDGYVSKNDMLGLVEYLEKWEGEQSAEADVSN